MGVATDAKALVPTKFVFQYPVYLENDREYALVVETNSTQYQTFISRLGETEINSNSTVTTQLFLVHCLRARIAIFGPRTNTKI